ncbi:MAG: translation initiation factor IF-2 subunit alpha [Thaumarchaeota archaeon]|nr:translation initiation factor IF-2 subunit alpha [Nitrososphaerota archaeon]
MEAISGEMPEEGEIVIATATEVTKYGVYVSLDEYNNMRGFLHISEISTGWVRHIDRYVRPKQKVVLKVIRVNRERREVDLSLRQVTGEERKSKLIAVKRAEKAFSIMEIIRAKLNISQQEEAALNQKLMEKYGGTYEALEVLVKLGSKAWETLGVNAEQLSVIETVAKEKITIPTVSIRGNIEARSDLPQGIEVIKKAMLAAEAVGDGGVVEVRYVGAPRYTITVTAENYKIAEKVLENAVETAKTAIEKSKGTFIFKRT